MTRMNQFAPAGERRSQSRVACNWLGANEIESKRTLRGARGFSRGAAGVPAAERLTMRARTPEDCDRLFTERVNAGEVEGVVALYEEQGRFVQRDGGPATGHSEIRKVIARMVATRPTLRSEVVKVVRAGEDLA